MSERETDQLLVERVQRGDKGAFDLLVRKYQHRILALVSRYVRDHAEAEDVAQDSFIKAYRALAGFRGESAFYTWLYRIAVNTAKNHLVSEGRQPQALEALDGGLDDEPFDVDLVLQERDTPEGLLLGSELARCLSAALAALPADLRTAITLREFEGLSYEEIADTMDCPIGTVRSRIFRARVAISKDIYPLLDEKDRSYVE